MDVSLQLPNNSKNKIKDYKNICALDIAAILQNLYRRWKGIVIYHAFAHEHVGKCRYLALSRHCKSHKNQDRRRLQLSENGQAEGKGRGSKTVGTLLQLRSHQPSDLPEVVPTTTRGNGRPPTKF